MAKHKKKAQGLNLSFGRLLKFFVTAFIYTLIVFSLLLTFLPKENSKSLSGNSNTSLQQFASEHNKQGNSRPSLTEESSNTVFKSSARSVTRIGDIKNAFNSGKYVDLSVLRPEMLGDTSIKEASFLPEVKNLLLTQLFSLMNKSDWYSWKESLKLANSTRSTARIFVDDVRIINFQLGRYLETAALLISALYLNTTNGRIFSTEEALFNLVNQSNDLFANRTPAALSPRIYLDTMITDDNSFTKVFEELRSKLVASYGRKRPQELDTQLLLLGSIDKSFYTNEIIKLYLDNLTRITNKVSPRFREELRVHYLLPDQVKDLVEIDPSIGDAVQEIYAASIRYYLKQGDFKIAKSILLQLASFSTNRSDLEFLGKEIEEQSDSGQMKNLVPPSTQDLVRNNDTNLEASPIRLFPIGSSVAEKVSGSLQGYAFVFALIVFVLILFKKVREVLFALMLGIKNRFTKSDNGDFTHAKRKGNFTEELDASIKSGKTVPMASISRVKGGDKKVVNS